MIGGTKVVLIRTLNPEAVPIVFLNDLRSVFTEALEATIGEEEVGRLRATGVEDKEKSSFRVAGPSRVEGTFSSGRSRRPKDGPESGISSFSRLMRAAAYLRQARSTSLLLQIRKSH